MIKKKIAALVLLTSLFASFSIQAREVELNPSHPDQYVVQKGDTLWDISAMFLRDPWLWPEIWHVNEQIANPHLIYPGDILRLVYIDGRPIIMVERGDKLTPKTRIVDLESAIPTIPLTAIQQFLSKPRVVDEETIDNAPKIVAIEDERVIAGLDDIIYATGLQKQDIAKYSVLRKGRPYIDPQTKEKLGYEALYLGEASLKEFGATSTLHIIESEREILRKDRLLPAEERELIPFFTPHAPKQNIDARIMTIFDGLTQLGQFQIITVNVGAEDGIDEGTVLGLYHVGKTIKSDNEDVKLPDEKVGEAMVFRTYQKMSIAIVLKAYKDMTIRDIIKNP